MIHMTMNGTCGCSGIDHRMDRHVELALLVLLREKPAYGYEALAQLDAFSLDVPSLNPGTLYRTLRRMEKNGLVESGWTPGQQGPNRRVYTVTSSGERHLETWIGVLKTRKTTITSMIERYEMTQGGIRDERS